jgi:hypothetical protein
MGIKTASKNEGWFVLTLITHRESLHLLSGMKRHINTSQDGSTIIVVLQE